MRKGINTLKCLVMATFVALCGCSDPNELKTASRDFTDSIKLRLEDYIDAADSMAFFTCTESTPLLEEQASSPLPFAVYQTRLKRDFDDFAKAMKYKEREIWAGGIYFDKQWTAYYVELYRQGKPIDTTNINATFETQGLRKNGYIYYFADNDKVAEFFESRNIKKMTWGCWPDKRGPQPKAFKPAKRKERISEPQPMVFKPGYRNRKR
jgi:hypothetical protein